MKRVIEENKDKYYLCLRGGQTEEEGARMHLVKWIEFYPECLAKQKDTLLRKLEKEKTLISLAKRNTVKSHLFKLIKAKQIKKEGIGKGTAYYI